MKTMRYLSWLAIAAMIFTGCSERYDPFYSSRNGSGYNGGNNGGNGGNNQQPATTVTERDDWKVQYKGRTDYQETDGSVSRVEEFFFNYTGNNLFILRTLTSADMENFYNNDVRKLIEGEVKDVKTMAGNQGKTVPEMDNIFDKSTKTLYADIMLHGSYTAYLIELDSNGNPTYNYCYAPMTVIEEQATAEYNTWLGTWTVTTGLVGYSITVSPLENNYLYRVDGWESGDAAGDVQMNQDDDWIQTRFHKDDQTMSFFIQFISAYENYEDLGDVDYMFVGTYVESTGEKTDDWEGWEVAWAEMGAGGNATLNAGNTEYEVNGEVYKPHFNSMRYSLYSYKDETWHHFHSAVPKFREENNWQMSMVKTKAEIVTDTTPVHTKSFLRKTQPRQYQGKKMLREVTAD